MVWALLVFLGVPLWICAAGIIILIVRNRSIKHRAGNIPVRVLRPGKSRWMRGHADLGLGRLRGQGEPRGLA